MKVKFKSWMCCKRLRNKDKIIKMKAACRLLLRLFFIRVSGMQDTDLQANLDVEIKNEIAAYGT